MATISFNQLTSAPYVTRAISRIRTPLSKFQDFFRMGPGQGNTQGVTGRYVGWDIFDKTRKLAKGRSPGTGPSTVAANPIGHVNAVVLRAHEKIPLLLERIFNTRPLGGQWGNQEVDTRGQKYVTAQEEFLAQKFRNFREFVVSRMLRGGFYVVNNGEDWICTDSSSGAAFQVNFQIPAGNKSQLNMTDLNGTSIHGGDIIGTTWSNTAAPIHQDLLQINAAFEQQHGWPLRHVWVNSNTWYYITKNTELINLSGTANTVILQYDPMAADETGFDTIIRGIPWLRWHVYDAVLETEATDASVSSAKLVPDNVAIFMPDPTSTWVEGLEGSELVQETPWSAPFVGEGFNAWTEPRTQPPQAELIALDNFIPALYIPTCIAYGSVVFP